MSSFYTILRAVHANVYDLPMKQFSKPKIYTGGVDIANWGKLTAKEKEKALSKRWYVYFSYRHPETNLLVRQANIHWGANEYASKEDRFNYLNRIRIKIQSGLQLGFNPYEENQPFYENMVF